MKDAIRLGHSPDSDDAFMFYGLAEGKIDTYGLEFEHVVEDIESLNRRALSGELEVTAISIHAYAYVSDNYSLLTSGASMGDRYGPLLVSSHFTTADEIVEKKIAIPGTMTTAFLTLNLLTTEFEYIVVPFDQILERVADGKADAGLIIHEGQLTYKKMGLHKIIDLGEWWHQETGLPLPLGGNVVRKDLGEEKMKLIGRIVRASIQYSLDHRKEALSYALNWARGMDENLADTFIGMYVNDYTLDCGQRGKKAIETLLGRGFEEGVIPKQIQVEFAG